VTYKRIYDISITLVEESMDLPSGPACVQTVEDRVIGVDAYRGTSLSMFVHGGTHVDAPRHIRPFEKSIDEYPLSRFILPATVVRIENREAITVEELKDLTIRPGQALIFHSRNSEEGLPVKRDGKGPMEDYVHMSPEAVEYAHSKGVSLLGFDYSLPEKSPGLDAVIHRMCFERDILIMETLNLKGVPTGDYTLLALPLKIVHADGAPVRAVLLEE